LTVSSFCRTASTQKKNSSIKKASNDDDEAWLEALENGQLDDNGCIPKQRDVSLLTARQKTKLMSATGGSSAAASSSLSSCFSNGGLRAVQLSGEAKRKREKENLKRKVQTIRKRGETKRQTLEKLLKTVAGDHHSHHSKIGSRRNSAVAGGDKSVVVTSAPVATQKPTVPMIRCVSNATRTVISYPAGVGCPVKASPVEPPALRLCDVCKANPRKYECSTNRKSLCSLRCYKQNMEEQKLVTVEAAACV